jgi:2-C-methyl-D-erythritol 2,4-cyclodiphosphate synthase
VDIPHTKGLLGHSDADVLLHAITDAIFAFRGAGRYRAAFSGYRSAL